MITGVQLTNFQKHKSLAISFRPGLNVIVGQTESGKSTIIRALKWAGTHEPGSGVTTRGETACGVTITATRGTVHRFVSTSESGYSIGEDKLVAVGTKQPDEVRKILKLTDLNFQMQHDAPFILSLTAGQAAREIDRLTGLGKIAQCQAWIKSEERATKSGHATVTQMIEGFNLTIKNLEWVTEAKERFDALKAQYSILEKTEQKLNRVIEASKRLQDASERLEDLEPLVSDCDAAMAEIRVLERKVNGQLVSRLESLITKTEEAATKLLFLECSGVLDRLEEIIASDVPKSTTSRIANLETVLKKIEHVDKTIQGLEEYSSSLNEVCPHCGQPISR